MERCLCRQCQCGPILNHIMQPTGIMQGVGREMVQTPCPTQASCCNQRGPPAPSRHVALHHPTGLCYHRHCSPTKSLQGGYLSRCPHPLRTLPHPQ
jgi:hypothetical protein